MQILKVDLSQEVPLIDVLVSGPRGTRRLKMVFDTGCGMTQIDTAALENLGYSAVNAIERKTVTGPGGDQCEGYSVLLTELRVFGRTFQRTEVAAFDFDNYADFGIEGLFGFDVIKLIHLELDGPNGLLKIY